MISLPVTHYEIIYGSIVLVVILVVGFVYELKQGATKVYTKNEIAHGGNGSMLIKAFIETIFLDMFASEPMAACHTQAFYESKAHVKRASHILVFYGFVLLLISTIIGFAFDRWITPYAFSKAFYLGPLGSVIETGLGVVGGIIILAGVAIYWPVRYRGEGWKALSAADLFLLLLAFTVITGFLLELAEEYSLYVAAAFWIHMAFIFALFATMPFTKFSHALYQIIWNTHDRFYRKVALNKGEES
ncbi:MAG: hypothetical protein QXV38_03445 [Conexivisphaerales archaeon]